MDYTQYSVEDLASDHSFIKWASRSDPESEKFWDDFISQHPAMRVKITQARTLVLNLGRAEARNISDAQISSLWRGIEDRIASVQGPERKLKNSFFLNYSLAAALSFIFFSVIWYTFSGTDSSQEVFTADERTGESDFIEEVNTSGNILRVHLSDGSTVALQNNSRLKYKKHYQGEASRVVYLTGEAFFEVARNPTQPFLVHSSEVVTRVLGTSFWVKAPDGEEEVIVSVKTGKVSVYALNEGDIDEESQKNAIILLPNQQVTYLRDQESFGKALVPEPEIVQPTVDETDFTFENTPIKEVFGILEEAYGIEIIFDEEVMSNCFITAPLGSEPLFEKLKIICRAIGARYETIDAKLVITSAGC